MRILKKENAAEDRSGMVEAVQVLHGLWEQAFETRDLEEQEVLYQRMLSYAAECVTYGLSSARQYIAIGKERLGDACMRRGKPEQALPFYEESISIREDMAGETVSLLARRKLADGYRKLGDAYAEIRDDNSGEKAEEYYRNAILLYILLEDETSDWFRLSEVNYLREGKCFNDKPDCTTIGFTETILDDRKRRYSEKPSLHGAMSWLFQYWRYASQLCSIQSEDEALTVYADLLEAARRCVQDGFPVAELFVAVAEEQIGSLLLHRVIIEAEDGRRRLTPSNIYKDKIHNFIKL